MPANPIPTVYLTFDDGPHPTATPYAIQQLEEYNSTASFFCIGKNVALYPNIYSQLIEKGHTVCNHTHNHLNGWKTDDTSYLKNIYQARSYIDSFSIRPPYGRIRKSQAIELLSTQPKWKIYMWSILSYDFDRTTTPEQCLTNVVRHLEPGAIVVFHDSEKAWERMQYALPRVLEYCKKMNWKVEGLPKY